jgi:hypothetical protein
MKLIRKIAFILFTLLLLLVTGISIVAYYYGDEIKQLVVSNLNKQLRTEVEVKEVDFSVWQSFPKASVVFSDVVIHSVDAKNDTLLAAQRISAQFNLLDLYKGVYKLIGLEIYKGRCHMIVDNSGRANYVFWKASDSTSSSFSTELEKVQITEMEFAYQDFTKRVDILFHIKQSELKGRFKESIFELQIRSDLNASHLVIGDTRLFENRHLLLNAIGTVNQSEQSITLAPSKLGVDGMSLALEGSYFFGKESRLNLSVKGEDAELKKAIALTPQSFKDRLSPYSISGNATFSGSISGSISAISVPSYSFNFSIENGQFIDRNNAISFTNSFLSGNINNGAENKLETSEVLLERFETNLNEGFLDGELRLINFKHPSYSYEGTLRFDFKDAVALFGWKNIHEPAGKITAALKVNGSLEDINKYTLNDWKSSTIQGKVTISSMAFQYESYPQSFKQIDAQLNFNNNSVAVDSLKATIDESTLNLKGKFNNLIGFLLEKEQALFIDAHLSSPMIDLASFLYAPNSKEEEKSYSLDISPYITVYLEAAVDSLVFNTFQLSQLQSSFIIKDERIDARSLSFSSQEGKFIGDLFIRERANNLLSLYSEADLRAVNIKKLFESFNNFGQKTLKAEHISGLADANIRFRSNWTKELEIDRKSIEVEADLFIADGVLSNFKPLESLSRFIELEELKNVRFKEIRNQILIQNETVTIPRFNLESTALNVSIAGTHSFDNHIDYRFTLLLSELLDRKVKKPKENEFGYVEDDGLGRSKLFLKMIGTVDNPVIKYDSKELGKELKNKIAREKQEFKSILKEEFGLFKKDTSLKKSPTREQKQSPFQVEYDTSLVKKKVVKERSSRDTEEEKSQEKSKFGKFLDKIAKPNEEEYREALEE